MNEIIMTVAEVSKFLKIGTTKIYDLAKKRKIPMVKVGVRQYRVSRTVLLEWLASKRVDLVSNSGGADAKDSGTSGQQRDGSKGAP